MASDKMMDALRKRIRTADEKSSPRGWVQWKGTDVCIDLHCVCGETSHFDGDFFYFWRCPHCGVGYAVGQNVTLHMLSAEEADIVEEAGRMQNTSKDD